MSVVALRAIDVRRDALRAAVLVRMVVVGVRVAVRAADACRDVVVFFVPLVVVARDDMLVAVRADTCLLFCDVDVRVNTLLPVRGVVARSRIVCACFAVAFVTRVTAFTFDETAGVLVFLRADVTVFVSPRRVAARTASSESVAHASLIPSNARHTAKIILIPFILMCDSVANFRKSGQAKYEI